MRISDWSSDVCSSDLTYDPLNPVIDTSNDNRGQIDDALGGRAYYQGRIELDIPLGTGAKELGLRPSIFLDVGSVWSVKRPTLTTLADFSDPADENGRTSCMEGG